MHLTEAGYTKVTAQQVATLIDLLRAGHRLREQETVYISTAQMGGNDMQEFLQKVEVLMREMGRPVPERK